MEKTVKTQLGKTDALPVLLEKNTGQGSYHVHVLLSIRILICTHKLYPYRFFFSSRRSKERGRSSSEGSPWIFNAWYCLIHILILDRLVINFSICILLYFFQGNGEKQATTSLKRIAVLILIQEHVVSPNKLELIWKKLMILRMKIIITVRKYSATPSQNVVNGTLLEVKECLSNPS